MGDTTNNAHDHTVCLPAFYLDFTDCFALKILLCEFGQPLRSHIFRVSDISNFELFRFIYRMSC